MRPRADAMRVLVALAGGALAAGAEAYQPDYEVETTLESVVIAPNGGYTRTLEETLVVRTEQGVKGLRQITIPFSTSLHQVEVLEAYTISPAGKRIDVPANGVQERAGLVQQIPTFSDVRSKVIVYPAVEVGAKLHYKMTLKQPAATFPGHFSMVRSFPNVVPYGRVEVDVYAEPSRLDLKTFAHGVEEQPVAAGSRRHWRWTYSNPVAVAPEPGAIDAIDYAPRLEVSSFPSFEAIAEAYDDRAFPTTRLSKAIRQQADELTAGITEPREQARVLYEWVARHIRYAENLMGHGAVVPRDGDVVLRTRFGDCKDHVTLYEAMLAAKGIRSEAVLINTGSSYTLGALPVSTRFDHVISYIPDFDLYADPSADLVPFGTLPFALAGKPVVHVGRGRKATPPVSHRSLHSAQRSTVRLGADGSSEGEIRNTESAYLATETRSRLEHMNAQDKQQVVSHFLSQRGLAGTGEFTHAEPRAHADAFWYALTYRASNGWNVPGPGAITPGTVMSPVMPLSRFGTLVSAPARKLDYFCIGGTSVEEITYVFPPGVRILSVPRGMRIDTPALKYESSYRRDGQVVTVLRKSTEPHDSKLCSPADFEQARKSAAGIVRDLQAQILYE